MPSIAAPAAGSSPNPVGAYAVVKTPDTSGQTRSKRFGPSPWATKHWYLGSLAQLLAFGAIGLFVFGQVAYAAPVYWTHLKVTMTKWWGVRTEMVRPTYLFLFCGVTFLACLLLVEFLRHFNARRITSRYVLKLAQLLRRKPHAFGKVSPLSYGELLFLLCLVGGNVFVLLGFSCLFNLAFLLIPATRNSAFMEVLGISYANGVKYHRWLGVFTVLFAVLHCIPYYWKWARKDKLLHESFPCFNCSIKDGEEGHERWVTFFGELALLCFLAMSFSAIPYVRRNFFNVFYYVHHLFFIALVFVVLHWAGFVWFLLAPVLGYLMSRFLSTSNSFTAVQVTEFTSLSGEFVKIVVSRSALRDGDFQVGKFVYINVPAVSQLQWHPFSVASSPRSSATSLTLIMKSLGDWTNAVTEYCDECKKNNTLPTVYLDGYYGSSYEFYEDYSTVCLVAGGVGVTPLLAILNDMVAKIVDREQLHQKVYFIFTFRELSLLEELHPLLLKIRELDPEETYFSLVFSLTREPTESMLERKIDHERLHGFDNLTPTHNGDGSHKPFAVPLQSRATKSLVYVTVFALAVAVLVVIEYGGAGKIEEHNGELWAVQNFVEVVVIFVCALLVFGFVYLERKVLAKSKSSGATELSEKHPGDVGVVPFTSQLHAADIHTYRDLVAQYNVAIGPRLDLQSTLREVFSAHQTFVASHPSSAKDAAAGIFVSGPSSLKASVDEAVSAIDSSSFDIFTEEFQL
ncbi:hypothetical protein PybrP1_011416 [[Pythium] brassicae (nom. inval.)]|nr:hypothetical protein PybrP1_011416 [[Pythium] brassicae (nom. inval.)]